MSTTSRRLVIPLVLISCAWLAATVPAGAGPAPAPERKYLGVRAEEDWTWLESTPPADEDPFDAVKNVRLSDAWTFLLGGSARLRVEMDDGKTLGASTEESDEQGRLRTNLHWEIRHAKDFRWFAEIRYSDTFMTDRPNVSVFMEDDPDVSAFFLEGTFASKTKHPVTIRAGRQDLLFGAQRLVSPLDWSNVRRQWDGVSIIAKTPRTKTTFFATRPVVHQKHELDDASEKVSFSGAHFQIKPKDGHVVEAYAFLLHDASMKYRSETSNSVGDIDRLTWGARWEWSKGNWGGDVEAALQAGDAADDDISAGMISTTVGYQWKKAKVKPRLSFGLDHASGNDDPGDGDASTFDQLYPLGHAYFGHVDLVGRRNTDALRAQFECWPAKGWKLEAALHRFRLAEAEDAMYDAGGAGLRRDATGDAGRDVGTELDVMATWTFKTHHSFGIELARFWTGGFIERTGVADDVLWGWMGYEFKF